MTDNNPTPTALDSSTQNSNPTLRDLNSALRDLVTETATVTGTPAPDFLASDHPTFSTFPAESLYFIGVIGGKDVGKSSLVNALAAAPIASVTSHGEGTHSILAYAHRSRADEVLAYLRAHIDDRAAVAAHDLSHLLNQVLLDLPDIDSLHDAHVAITRRALRHLLFPIWAQSVEKYADLMPRKLLSAVAQGNDPTNFTFVLTKADQLPPGQSARQSLRDDYAGRLAETLRLPTPPTIYLTSANSPDDFDLPQLREKLSRQKSAASVEHSTRLAVVRQDRSILDWFDAQHLDERAARLQRFEDDARDRIHDRIARPILDPAIAALQTDPGPRASAADESLGRRAAHWPILSLIHISLIPLSVMLRRFASPPATTPALVDSHLPAAELSTAIKTTFAHLEATSPGLAAINLAAINLTPIALTDSSDQKLWNTMPADLAVADLRRRLIETLDRQRITAIERASSSSLWLAPIRWLFTIGALLWFPLGQPILEALLQRDRPTLHELLLTLVRMLSVAHLLESLTFLIAYFLILYLFLRRSAHRRVARLFAQWENSSADPSLNLSAQTADWIANLTAPITAEREQLTALLDRAQSLRSNHTSRVDSAIDDQHRPSGGR